MPKPTDKWAWTPMVHGAWACLFMEPASRDVLCCARWYHCAMATRCCGIAGGFAVDFSCAWCMLGVAVSVGSVEEGVSLGLQELGTLLHLAVVAGVAVIGLLSGGPPRATGTVAEPAIMTFCAIFCQQILRIVPGSEMSTWAPLVRRSLLDDAPASHLISNCKKPSPQLVQLKNVEYYFE